MKAPNIVFIFSDQQRPDTIGAYNDTIDFTPHLDALAAGGVRFSDAYTCQPVCGPARACLQTGLYATELGCYRNGIALPLDADTIAKRLNARGYDTGYLGKWHLASTQGASHQDIGERAEYGTVAVPTERRGGYEDFWLASDILEFTSNAKGGYLHDKCGNRVDFGYYRAERMTDFAVEYIHNRQGDKPFFLFISYIEPHHQNDANHFQGPDGSKERYARYPIPGDLLPFEGDWREEYPDYLGCCAALDGCVGRVVEALEQTGLREDTVIVYTSDHGSHFRTRNSEYKRSCHDACIHIPLIINGPGFTGGQVSDALVSLLDLPITILDIAGAERTQGMQGHSLKGLMEGDAAWPEEVFLQISESHVGRAIRTRRWKYAVAAPGKDGWLDAGSDTYEEAFLYDLENDPFELANLVGEVGYDDIRAGLRERLISRMLSAGEAIPTIISAKNN